MSDGIGSVNSTIQPMHLRCSAQFCKMYAHVDRPYSERQFRPMLIMRTFLAQSVQGFFSHRKPTFTPSYRYCPDSVGGMGTGSLVGTLAHRLAWWGNSSEMVSCLDYHWSLSLVGHLDDRRPDSDRCVVDLGHDHDHLC